MKLSIVILNYRTKKFTDKCISKIFQYSIDVPFEVIVVDNYSEDDSLEYLKSRWKDRVKCIQAKRNGGYAYGNNLGIKEALGEYILIMNPDIEVMENSINKLLHYLDVNDKCGIVGPQLIYPDGTIQDSYRTFPTYFDLIIKRTFLRALFKKRMHSYLMYKRDNNSTFTVDWLVGASFLVRKDFLKQVGGFDERFFLFLEDTDLCRQCWKNNKQVVYFPASKMIHNHERLSGANFFDAITKKTFYIHIMSALKYFWKWRSILKINNEFCPAMRDES